MGSEGQVYSWQLRMLLLDHQFLGMVPPQLAVPKGAHHNYWKRDRKCVFGYNKHFNKPQAKTGHMALIYQDCPTHKGY